jgi:hypothetical protein
MTHLFSATQQDGGNQYYNIENGEIITVSMPNKPRIGDKLSKLGFTNNEYEVLEILEEKEHELRLETPAKVYKLRIKKLELY